MDIYKKKRQQLKDYFNKVAATRIKYRKSKRYYWDSITKYVDFFVHDESSVLELGCGTGESVSYTHLTLPTKRIV